MFIAAAAGLMLAAFQTEPGVQRIHLRNGDYIEGRVLSTTPSSLEIRVEDGVLHLSRSQVRKVELVVLRTQALPPPPEAAKEPAPGLPAKGPPKYVVLVPLSVVQGVRFRIDAVFEALRRGMLSREDAQRRILDCGPEGAPHLAALLERLEPERRDLAEQCLAVLNSSATLPMLLKLLESEDAAVRIAAAGLAGRLGEKEAVRKLLGLFKDRAAGVRAAAATALESLDDPGVLDGLSALFTDPDPGARAAAIDATIKLARRHEMRENLLCAFERSLKWPVKGTEPDLLKALAASGDPEAWTIAAAHLDSASDAVRAAAAMALGTLGAAESAASIVERMEVELKVEPRIQLALTAERLRLPGAAPVLVEWLGAPEESVRRAAVRALRSVSGQELADDPAAWREWLKGR